MFLMISLKLLFGFIGLVIVMRIVGKKALSDLTPFDILYSLVLGGILEESIYDNNVHIFHLLFALAIWGAIIYTMEVLLQRNERATMQTKGHPSVLVYKGQLNLQEMTDNHIEMEQLRSLLRSQGYFSLAQVEYAVLEMNGQLTIIENPDANSVFTYLLVDEGKMKERALETIEKDKKWLQKELGELGYLKVEKIVYAEWSEEEGFLCKTYEESFNGEIHLDG